MKPTHEETAKLFEETAAEYDIIDEVKHIIEYEPPKNNVINFQEWKEKHEIQTSKQKSFR